MMRDICDSSTFKTGSKLILAVELRSKTTSEFSPPKNISPYSSLARLFESWEASVRFLVGEVKRGSGDLSSSCSPPREKSLSN